MEYLLTDEELGFIQKYSKWITKNSKDDELLVRRREEMIMLRFDEKWPLRQIGDRYGISRERVRQIIGNTGKSKGGFNYGCGLELRELENKREYFRDKTVDDVASEFGVSYFTASSVMRRYRHKISVSDNSIPVAVGYKWEEWASMQLHKVSIENNLMPFGSPFDILSLDGVRIDVKAASKPSSIPPSHSHKKFANPRYSFAVGVDCREKTDFYMCIVAETEDVFIIPSIRIPSYRSPLRFSWPTARPHLSNWQQYHNRYDLILDHAKKICV